MNSQTCGHTAGYQTIIPVTLSFKLSAPAEDRPKLGMFFNYPSYYEKDAEGDGLSSSNDNTFFATLESPKTDIV